MSFCLKMFDKGKKDMQVMVTGLRYALRGVFHYNNPWQYIQIRLRYDLCLTGVSLRNTRKQFTFDMNEIIHCEPFKSSTALLLISSSSGKHKTAHSQTQRLKTQSMNFQYRVTNICIQQKAHTAHSTGE